MQRTTNSVSPSMGDYYPDPHDRDDAEDSDRQSIIGDPDNPNEIVTYAPKESFRLGYFDVMCLVMNRMIGTGIFNSPSRVMQGTNSTGASLLLWLAGIIYCLSGVHVYIEYGLNVPRYTINGVEQSVPRSGGDLNYLQYVYRKPAYRKNTVFMSTCLFGFAFIALGNMAGNSLSFALRVLTAAGQEKPSDGAVRGIALGIAALTCFIHAFSRRGGIWLNNLLAIIKVMILLLIIITAIVVGAGGLNTPNRTNENTRPSNAFDNASSDANGYAHAFLAIVFSFSGFEQPNYVMGEISRPRRKHPIAMLLGVGTIVLLYMAVNISYMVVVPNDKFAEANVALQFFQLTLGSNNETGRRIFNAFLAVSSMGNIIVMTYTAARVKQEIAKEGIIPWAKFFAQDGDMSLGRLLRWFQKRGMFSSLLRMRWLSPEQHRERTPIGAFLLHLLSCIILIFATWNMVPEDAYTLLTSLSAYVINAFFGVWLGLGILILRIWGPPKCPDTDTQGPAAVTPPSWREMTGKHINPILSVVCATIYVIGGLWPIIVTWVKPTVAQALKWWLIPTISWSIIGGGVLWFLGFMAVAWRIDKKYSKVLQVEKRPEFEKADGHDDAGEHTGRGVGGYVLVHETVYLSWVGRETLSANGPETMPFEEQMKTEPMVSSSPYAGTDFEAFFQAQQQQPQPQPQQQQNHDDSYGPGYR